MWLGVSLLQLRRANEVVPTKSNGPHCCGPLRADLIGRDGGIRTHDPLTPSQVRYQAALHPETDLEIWKS